MTTDLKQKIVPATVSILFTSAIIIQLVAFRPAPQDSSLPIVPSKTSPTSIQSDDSWDSPFGIFAAYTTEFPYFQSTMGLDNKAYWNWVDGHFVELGAHWTRSNLQLVWDFIEPEVGGGYCWENEFSTDSVVTRIYGSPAGVHWIGVFHEGGGNNPQRPPLRTPSDYPDEYARFVQAAVERYDGDGTDDLNSQVRVRYWQIGNEYMFWEKRGRSLDDYLNWARLTSHAIKQADPAARVVLIAATQGFYMEPWLKSAIEDLAPKGEIDAVDIHHWGSATEWKMPAVSQVRELLDSLGRKDAEIFSCEHGTWAGSPTNHPAQTEAEQARSLVKRFVYNLNNGLDKLLWSNLVEWHNFNGQVGSIFNSLGLISDGQSSGDPPERLNTTRIAYWSYWLLAQHLGNDIQHGEKVETDDGQVYLFRFPASTTAGVRFIGWAEAGSESIVIEEPGFTGQSFTLVPDRYGNVGNKAVVAADTVGNISVKLGPDPILLESN